MKRITLRKTLRRALAMLMVVLTMASLTITSSAAGQVLPSGCYVLYSLNQSTGLNVQYKNGSGGKVVIDEINGETNEIWILENVDFGPYVTLRPYHAQKCYLSGEKGFDGDLIIRQSFPSDRRLHWKPIAVGNGQYVFQNRATGYVIDCAYGHIDTVGNRYLTYKRNGFTEAQSIYPVRISTLTSKLTPSGRVTSLSRGVYSMRLHGNSSQAVNVQYKAGVGANIVCDPFSSETNEIVEIIPRGNGLYSIHFFHNSSLCLAPSSIFPDGRMTLKTYSSSDKSCLWEIYKVGSGYSFRNAKTLLMLDDYCYQTHSGAPIISYSYNGDNAQVFYLEKEKAPIVSPVPAGCYFNRKTDDWNAANIYHDININVNSNTPVYAMFSGTVQYLQYYKWKGGQRYLTSYGNCAVLTSDDGQWRVVYAHLSRFEDSDIVQQIKSSQTWQVSGSVNPPIQLKTEEVIAGEILGRIGKTGNASGYHLHIEVYRNGVRVDPTTLVSGLTR